MQETTNSGVLIIFSVAVCSTLAFIFYEKTKKNSNNNTNDEAESVNSNDSVINDSQSVISNDACISNSPAIPPENICCGVSDLRDLFPNFTGVWGNPVNSTGFNPDYTFLYDYTLEPALSHFDFSSSLWVEIMNILHHAVLLPLECGLSTFMYLLTCLDPASMIRFNLFINEWFKFRKTQESFPYIEGGMLFLLLWPFVSQYKLCEKLVYFKDVCAFRWLKKTKYYFYVVNIKNSKFSFPPLFDDFGLRRLFADLDDLTDLNENVPYLHGKTYVKDDGC